MRSLTSTLLAAQQATSFRPAVRVQLRPMSGMADRFITGATFTPATVPAGAQTAAVAAAGSLYLYALSAGQISVRSFNQTGLESPASTLATDPSANLIAAALLPAGGVCVVTTAPTGSCPVTAHYSPTPGSAFTTSDAFSFATGFPNSLLFGLSVTASPDGRLACAAQVQINTGSQTDTYLAAAVHAAGGGWGAVSFDTFDSGPTPPQGPLGQSGCAITYSQATTPGDWLIAQAASWTAQTTEIALTVFGDGALVAPFAWTPRQTVLATSLTSANGTQLSITGIARADAFTIGALERYTDASVSPTITITQSYTISVLTPQAWLQGNAREPQPRPPASAIAPAFDPSTQQLWLAGAQAVLLGQAPQTSDLSARLLRASRQESENGGKATILLDDSDGSLTHLAQDPETIGMRITLDFGYTTAAGQEFSPAGALWIASCSCQWNGETRLLEIDAHDQAELLAAWRPRRSFAWIPGQATISTIAGWIAGKAGIAYTPPASPSALAQIAPAFIIRPGQDGMRALMQLLARTPEVLKLTPAGATLVQPLAQATAVYSYGHASAHPVVAARATVHGSGVNHVLVLGKDQSTATSPSFLAEAIDNADAFREGPQPQVERDMYVPLALAPLRAQAVLQKAQLIQDAGELVTAPNCGLEIWDRIAVTCPATGWNATTFYVREIRTIYEVQKDGGTYSQSAGLFPFGTGIRT